MTDNNDLLGSEAAPVVPAPKKRGRPSLKPPVVTGEMPVITTETPKFDELLGGLVPAGTTEQKPTTLAEITEAGEGEPTLIGTDPAASGAEATILSEHNPDGSTSVVLPVSTEYAAAMANRVHIIGRSKPEYAYKRLLREGKKL